MCDTGKTRTFTRAFPHSESVRGKLFGTWYISQLREYFILSLDRKKKIEKKKDREKKARHLALLLSRHQQLHFDAKGRWRRAVCSQRDKRHRRKSFKVTAGRGRGSAQAKTQEKTCSRFRASAARPFITHRGGVPPFFRNLRQLRRKNAG